MVIFSIGKFPEMHWDGNIYIKKKKKTTISLKIFFPLCANLMSTSIKFVEYNNTHK